MASQVTDPEWWLDIVEVAELIAARDAEIAALKDRIIDLELENYDLHEQIEMERSHDHSG